MGKALANLADIASAVSGDLHTLHLNMRGPEFDTLHKGALKTYYEEAASDYDEWSEAALMFEDMPVVGNTNGAASRIDWQSFEGAVDRDIAVDRARLIIEGYMEAAVSLLGSLNSRPEDARCVGVANALQTRVEWWAKELHYFNARRKV